MNLSKDTIRFQASIIIFHNSKMNNNQDYKIKNIIINDKWLEVASDKKQEKGYGVLYFISRYMEKNLNHTII